MKSFVSHQLTNSFFSYNIHIPGVGRGSVTYSFWILVSAFRLENCRFPAANAHAKSSLQSTDAVDWDDELTSDGFESLLSVVRCGTIRY